MSATVTENKVVKSIPPVSITVDTYQELEWLYWAISQAVHLPGVDEDSRQQEFYCKLHPQLNEICGRYRTGERS